MYWLQGSNYVSKKDMEKEFYQIVWLHYRRNFSPINGLKTDVGWGCTVRCAQMLLFEAFRRSKQNYNSPENIIEILPMFFDTLEATFSIHQIASMGTTFGLTQGEWFGPHTASSVLKILLDGSSHSLKICLSQDRVVYLDEINALGRTDGSWNSVLLLVSSHVGSRISESTCRYIMNLFKCPEFIGFLGGRKNRAYYFVGMIENSQQLVYLDPHSCSDALVSLKQFQNDRIFSPSFNLIGVKSICPNFTQAFLLKSPTDVQLWVSFIQQCGINDIENGGLFEILPEKPENTDGVVEANNDEDKSYWEDTFVIL